LGVGRQQRRLLGKGQRHVRPLLLPRLLVKPRERCERRLAIGDQRPVVLARRAHVAEREVGPRLEQLRRLVARQVHPRLARQRARP
jgi:hypothetical protein